jgi:hypothetical protein
LARAYLLYDGRGDQAAFNAGGRGQRSAEQPNANRPPASHKETYIPYAIREGLYERGWKDYLQLLTRFWQPYLENKSTFDDAIARMVSAL